MLVSYCPLTQRAASLLGDGGQWTPLPAHPGQSRGDAAGDLFWRGPCHCWLRLAGACVTQPQSRRPHSQGLTSFRSPRILRYSVWCGRLGRPGHLRAGSVDDLAAGDVGTSVVRTWIGCLCGVPCLSRVHDAVLGRCPGLLLLGLCPGCYRCPDPCLPPLPPHPYFYFFTFLVST